MCTGLHVKYPLLLFDFNETRISSTEFRKKLKYQMLLNPSSGSPGIPCGRTDTTKLTVAFRNYANAPNTDSLHKHLDTVSCVSRPGGTRRFVHS